MSTSTSHRPALRRAPTPSPPAAPVTPEALPPAPEPVPGTQRLEPPRFLPVFIGTATLGFLMHAGLNNALITCGLPGVPLSSGLLTPLVIGALTAMTAARSVRQVRALRQITLLGLGAGAQFTLMACFISFTSKEALAWAPVAICGASGLEMLIRSLRHALPGTLTDNPPRA